MSVQTVLDKLNAMAADKIADLDQMHAGNLTWLADTLTRNPSLKHADKENASVPAHEILKSSTFGLSVPPSTRKPVAAKSKFGKKSKPLGDRTNLPLDIPQDLSPIKNSASPVSLDGIGEEDLRLTPVIVEEENASTAVVEQPAKKSSVVIEETHVEAVEEPMEVEVEAPVPVTPPVDSNVICTVCNVDENDTQLLLCDTCDVGASHIYCCTPKLDAVPEGDWQCTTCKPPVNPDSNVVCTVCNIDENDTQVLLCDTCDTGACHMYCCTPKLDAVPKGDWQCTACLPPPPPVEELSKPTETKTRGRKAKEATTATARTTRQAAATTVKETEESQPVKRYPGRQRKKAEPVKYDMVDEPAAEEPEVMVESAPDPAESVKKTKKKTKKKSDSTLDIKSLRVVDLRKELKKHKLATYGVKSVLQARLLEFLNEQEDAEQTEEEDNVQEDVEELEQEEQEVVEKKDVIEKKTTRSRATKKTWTEVMETTVVATTVEAKPERKKRGRGAKAAAMVIENVVDEEPVPQEEEAVVEEEQPKRTSKSKKAKKKKVAEEEFVVETKSASASPASLSDVANIEADQPIEKKAKKGKKKKLMGRKKAVNIELIEEPAAIEDELKEKEKLVDAAAEAALPMTEPQTIVDGNKNEDENDDMNGMSSLAALERLSMERQSTTEEPAEKPKPIEPVLSPVKEASPVQKQSIDASPTPVKASTPPVVEEVHQITPVKMLNFDLAADSPDPSAPVASNVSPVVMKKLETSPKKEQVPSKESEEKFAKPGPPKFKKKVMQPFAPTVTASVKQTGLGLSSLLSPLENDRHRSVLPQAASSSSKSAVNTSSSSSMNASTNASQLDHSLDAVPKPAVEKSSTVKGSAAIKMSSTLSSLLNKHKSTASKPRDPLLSAKMKERRETANSKMTTPAEPKVTKTPATKEMGPPLAIETPMAATPNAVQLQKDLAAEAKQKVQRDQIVETTPHVEKDAVKPAVKKTETVASFSFTKKSDKKMEKPKIAKKMTVPQFASSVSKPSGGALKRPLIKPMEKKIKKMAKPNPSGQSTAASRLLQEKIRRKQEAQENNESKSAVTAPSTVSTHDAALKLALSKPKKAPVSPEAPLETYTQNMDENNYVMSDHEGDSDWSDEDDTPKKPIPVWARKENLAKALARQRTTDPDVIFSRKIAFESESCNLTKIFRGFRKRKRFNNRTSSGNWFLDRLQYQEENAYRAALGFSAKPKDPSSSPVKKKHSSAKSMR